MKKFYLFLIVLIMLLLCNVNVKAAPVTPPGFTPATPPQVSTSAAPVWYNMMSSNDGDVNRNYMFICFDGTNLKGKSIPAGISDAQQNDQYLWRLESSTNGVHIINKYSGSQMYLPTTAVNNDQVTMAANGAEWGMAASTTYAAAAVAGQYSFNLIGASKATFLINQGDNVTKGYNILIFDASGNASASRSSGWFFYPQSSTTLTVNFTQPANGTIEVTGTNGTQTPMNITSGTAVPVGTNATVTLTPVSGSSLVSLTVNGVDVTTSVVGNIYQYPVNTNNATSDVSTIAAVFSTVTGLEVVESDSYVYPNPFGNTLNIAGKVLNSNVFIYDLSGRLLKVQNTPTINTTDLAKGIYFVNFQTKDGLKQTKVIKE